MRLVVATRNAHKLRELAGLLAPHEVVALPENVILPDETGDTFAANALIKARAVHEATGLPALADDSGLEVDALGGAPGVRSARFAGDAASDADNLAKLLRELDGVPVEGRAARFRCVVALVEGARETLGTGTLEGRIALHPRGAGGFGYDPAFVPDGADRTVGEMGNEEKDAISHRSRAVADLLSQRDDLR